MSTIDPAELTSELQVAAGRRTPYTQLGDWVLLSGAEPEARTLYWALASHSTTQDAREQAGPSVRTLARILGVRKPDNVARFMLQLEVIGAVDVIRPTNTLNRHNRYVVTLCRSCNSRRGAGHLPGVDE